MAAVNVRLDTLGLPAGLLKKLDPIVDTKGLRAIRPVVLAAEWKVTEGQWAKIDLALRSRGYSGLPPYEAAPKPEPRAASLKGKCRKPVAVVDGATDAGEPTGQDEPCGRPLLEGKRSCLWHWLADQPIEKQVEKADERRRIAEREWRALHTEPFPFQARVPEREWPNGHRWCSECQMMIPLFYTTGSKCKAHASRAAHASMVERVYKITREEYDQLLAWQGGRCYICQQVPRVRRLAVDHDHVTGEVRGLLCANDEWGCNVLLRRLLGNLEMARAAVRYVEKYPIQRMRAGEDPVVVAKAPPSAAGARVREQARAAASTPARTQNDPFKGFL